MKKHSYVHGYSEREAQRLSDQAQTLEELLHHDSVFPAGSLILEAGCGTGAQTRVIARKNPDSKFVSMDISADSLAQAEKNIRGLGISNVRFIQKDILNLDFPENNFDHVFVCFVLEHLADPNAALCALSRVLKKHGSITVIEGDHGSAYFYPESRAASTAIQAQVELQASSGGNANIGRSLYPLLMQAEFSDCHVSPRMVYADSTRPELVEGFTKHTFTAMIEGIRDDAIAKNIMEARDFDQGIRDLYRTAEKDGVFCYTFFKGVGIK
ncbi:MAG: methyltransferase domain-containing protein [Spirochaetaceae bacterium]|nr:MAG: methyltransferase domain-containing protein [Spirochaetaceae bacterium]